MDGILLVAHGTIRDPSELPAFLRRIRHGREPSVELVREMEKRYAEIGGSPLLQTTEAQAKAVQAASGLRTFVAMRLWEPGVEEALQLAADEGISRLVVVPLAPFSVGVYHAAAERSRAARWQQVSASAGKDVQLVSVKPWGVEPDFIGAQADLIRRNLPSEAHELILTAHSLPLAAIRGGDQYAAEATACAEAIGKALAQPITLAFQSEGADGGQWLGPALKDVVADAAARGTRHLVIAPFGFLADHVETLYDLDIETRAQVTALGMKLMRVSALNLEPRFIRALVTIAKRALES